MTKRNEIHKCEKCSNMVEVVNEAAGELTCCDAPMKLLKENTVDAVTEKHVPVTEKIEGGYRVTVGEVEHPMTGGYYIRWTELVTPTEVLRKYLTPSDKPVVKFKTCATEVCIREYYNLHGLWRAE